MCESACVGGCDRMCENACVGFCDEMCENACVGGATGCARTLVWGFATGCVVFGLEKRNRDLNHKNLRIDLVQIKKFRSGP